MNFTQSNALLERALKVIPNGTQTFSKSRTQFPIGLSPFYIKNGYGSHVWDVDDNEYVDFISGLTPIILGYGDDDVDRAVISQINGSGVLFSLPHPIEIEVSELIRDIVPCAEMVRFGKNGSDVTAGAVRLTRAYTGRNHVACCGYHGWQDWYIGCTGRNAGVPKVVASLVHPFEYNNIESLDRIFKDYPGDVACVIMEPMNSQWPQNDFLGEVRDLTHKNGAVFVFDEVITGFRFEKGGAQEFFHVMPDIVCLGKAMANGYPLSAIAGKAEIMSWMEKIHFSFTNAGECLSLAACKATLNKIVEKNVPLELFALGTMLQSELEWPHSGHPSWTFLKFASMEEKTLFIQEMVKKGFLCIGTVNLNYSHTKDEIFNFVATCNDIWRKKEELKLEGEALKPIFAVR